MSFTDKSGVETPVSRAARAAAADPGWRYQEVFGPHDAMVTAPDEVARILLGLT